MFIPPSSTLRLSSHLARLSSLRGGLAVAALCLAPMAACAQGTASVALSVTAGAASLTGGTIDTLQATVTDSTSSAAISRGLVLFCDEGAGTATPTTATACRDSGLLGSAQLVAGGTATIKIKLAALSGLASHHIFAKFAGTPGAGAGAYATAVSGLSTFAVTSYSAAGVLTYSGTSAGYTLTDTVVGGPPSTGVDVYGAPSPSGTVNFVDVTNSNSALGLQTLGTAAEGFVTPVPYPFVASAATTSQTSAGMEGSRVIVTGDFNGDGIPDLVVFGSRCFSFMQGVGDGSFTYNPALTYTTSSTVVSASVGDFDGDGNLDIMAVAGNAIYFFKGNGAGGFTGTASTYGTYTQTYVPNDYAATSVAVGDFNGDGILDVAVGYCVGTSGSVGTCGGTITGAVVIYTGSITSGVYSLPATGVTLTATSGEVYGVASGDLNNDGLTDLAISFYNPSTTLATYDTILTYTNSSPTPGTLTLNSTNNNVANGPYQSNQLQIADMKGDGTGDVIFLTSNAVGELVGPASGSPAAMVQPANIAFAASYQAGLAIGDFNGDGYLDVAVGGTTSTSNLYTVNGSSTGALGTVTTHATTGGTPWGITVGDFAGTGNADIATALYVTSSTAASVNVFFTGQNATVTQPDVVITGLTSQVVDATFSNSSYATGTSNTVTLADLALTTSVVSPQNYGTSITLTATLSSGSSASGNVAFYANGSLIGSAALSSGTASVMATLPAGNDVLSAVYTSPTGLSTVTSPDIDFTIKSTTPSQLVYGQKPTSYALLAGSTAGVVTITVEDASGNVYLPGSGDTVTLKVYASTSTAGTTYGNGLANATTMVATIAGTSGTTTAAGSAYPWTAIYNASTGVATFDVSQIPLTAISAGTTTYSYVATASANSVNLATSPAIVTLGIASDPYYIVNVYTDPMTGTAANCVNFNMASPAGGNACALRDAFAAISGGTTGNTVGFSNNGTTTPQVITLMSNLPNPSHTLSLNGPGPAYLTISGNGAYTILNGSATAMSVTGMTLANAYGASSGAALSYSGTEGLYVNNVDFINNFAGQSASVTYNGGAIYMSGPGTMTLLNSSFINNGATSPPGVNIVSEYPVSAATGGTQTASSQYVQFNTNGPTHFVVGAIVPYIFGLTSCTTYNETGTPTATISAVSNAAPYSFTLSYSTAQSCTSTATEAGIVSLGGEGGAIYISNGSSTSTGTSVTSASDEHVNINNCMFIGNSAYYGGAIYDQTYAAFAFTTVANSTFYNNTAIKYGSAIATSQPLQITNSTIVGNTAYYPLDYDGAVTGMGTTTTAEGNITLYNTVVADNVGPQAADLAIDGGNSTYAAYNTLTYGSSNIVGGKNTSPSSYSSLSSLGLTTPAFYGTSTATPGNTTTDLVVTGESTSGTAVTFTTSTPPSYAVNQDVYVTGLTSACGLQLTNKVFQVASVSSTGFTAPTVISCGAAGTGDSGSAWSTALHTMALQPGSLLQGKGTFTTMTASVTGVSTTNTIPITGVSTTGSVATFTNSGTNGFVAGQTIYLTGLTSAVGALYTNKYLVIATVPSSTSFTVASSVAAATGTETAAAVDPILTFTAANSFTAGQIVYVSGLGNTNCDGYFNNRYFLILSATSSSFTASAATGSPSSTTSPLCPVITAVSTTGGTNSVVKFTTAVSSGLGVGATVYVSGLTSACGTTYNNQNFVITAVSTSSPYSFSAAAGNTSASCSGSGEQGTVSTTNEVATATLGPSPTDERGFTRDPGSSDIGALQSNLSMTVGSVANQNVGVTFTPAPTATVKESGFGESGVAVTASLSSGVLGGTTTATTNSSGVATFSSLISDTAETGIVLIADAGPDTLTGSSSTFNILAGPVAQLSFVTAPATPITAGGTAGSAVTIKEVDAYGNLSGPDTITLTVTGPSSYSQVHTATAVNGIATFNLSTFPLNAAGTYSYVATVGAITSPTATEVVTAGAVTALTATFSPATLGVATTVTVTAVDADGNIVTSFPNTDAVTLTSSTDPTGTFSAPADLTNGVGTFTATFDTAGASQTVTATAATGGYTATSTPVVVSDPIWLINATGTLDKISAYGTQLSGAVGMSGTASGMGGISFDSAGNVWSVTSANNSLSSVSKTGVSLGNYSGGGLSAPVSVSVDGSGYIWIANSGNASVSAFNNSGTAVSPSFGYGTSGTAAIGATPSSIAIDNAGGVWVTSSSANSVTHIVGVAAPITTPTATAVANGKVGVTP